MTAFNAIVDTAAVLSLVSLGAEAVSGGAKRASQSAKTSVAINDIKDYTGDSVLNKSSEKHNAMKEMVRQADSSTWFHKASGAISGFFRGAANASKGNLPTFGFSVLALAAKSKTTKTIGVVGMGISTLWDFIANGTNLFTSKNKIEK